MKVLYFIEYFKPGFAGAVDLTVGARSIVQAKKHGTEVASRKGYRIYRILAKPEGACGESPTLVAGPFRVVLGG
jgi:hypothetical protein